MEQRSSSGSIAAMLRIRRFEDTVHLLFLQNEIEGTTHLCQGQEAVSVGVCDLLEPGDTVAATYRGHGACLAMGVDPARLFAELLGRETGLNGGRGGSMNVVDLEHGVIGCFGIVGGSIGAGTGAALAAQLWGTARSRSRSSATGPSTRRTSTNASTSLPFAGCPSCTSARTTCTASGRPWSG